MIATIGATKMAKKIHTRKITKGNKYSFYVNIPSDVMDDLKWRAKQKVTVKRIGSKIIIQDWKKPSK